MNGIIGLIIAIIGLLGFIIVMASTFSKKSNIFNMIILSPTFLILVALGFGIASEHAYRCCETINFTDTCKVCGYDPNDKWICCNTYNSRKYCTKCGKERKSENEQYVYCCEKKYNIDKDNYCSVCGEKIEK